MKKLLRLGLVAGIGYWIYRVFTGKRAEEDLWHEATEGYEFEESAQEPDLR